jgi:hypothetical protein
MKRILLIAAVVIAAVTLSQAATRLPSADGQFRDIQDTSPWAPDSGGLAHDGGERFDSITPVLVAGERRERERSGGA